MTTLDPAPADVREQPPVDGEPCVLLKLGEVVLKGKNREQFERRLQNNIRAALRPIAKVGHGQAARRLRHPQATSADPATMSGSPARVADVMGIVWAHRAWRVAKDVDAIERAALELIGRRGGPAAPRSRSGPAAATSGSP